MTFINEYILEEDIKKYDLIEVKYKGKGVPKKTAYKFNWTVNKKEDCFLFLIENIKSDTNTGLMVEPTNKYFFLFCYKGKNNFLVLEKNRSSSISLKDNPVVVKWDLKDSDAIEGEVLFMLRESLSVYGYGGIEINIPNASVEFGF